MGINNDAKNNCTSCQSYKKQMCICKSPAVNNKPFGFPFRYSPKAINCQSWKGKKPLDDITWAHM